MVCSLIGFILIIEVTFSFPLMCTAHLHTTILVTIWIGSYHCKNKLQNYTKTICVITGESYDSSVSTFELKHSCKVVTVKALLSTQMCQQRHNSKAYLICRIRMNACCMGMFSHTYFRYKWITVCHYRNTHQIKPSYCLQGSALDFFPPIFFKITWFSIIRSCLFQSVSANHRIWLSQ